MKGEAFRREGRSIGGYMASVDILPPVFPEAVPVVFGADDTFFIPLVVCIQSLVENTSPENNYDIVVLANKFRPQYVELLSRIAEGRPNVSIRVYDVAPFLACWDLSKLKTGHRLSLATYYRLFIPELMRDYDKVLYIDGDTVLLEDIAHLYEHDITGCYAGAVRDYNIIRDMSSSFKAHVQGLLGMEDTSQYFNAGVLLLDIAAMRRDFPLDFLMEQAQLKGAKHHDQDVLNSLFYGKVRFLHPRWNCMWQNEELYAPVEGGREALASPSLVHYPGSGKPWLKAGAFLPAARHYWKYALSCPYADEIVRVFHEDCRRSVREYPKALFQYFRYQLCAMVLGERKRRYYGGKAAKLREELRETRRIMRSGKHELPWQD